MVSASLRALLFTTRCCGTPSPLGWNIYGLSISTHGDKAYDDYKTLILKIEQCLILEPGFLLIFGTGQFVEVPNPVPGRMFALLDFRSENRILVVTISTVSMRQDSPISICLVFFVGG
jgi:hypothetical protein